MEIMKDGAPSTVAYVTGHSGSIFLKLREQGEERQCNWKFDNIKNHSSLQINSPLYPMGTILQKYNGVRSNFPPLLMPWRGGSGSKSPQLEIGNHSNSLLHILSKEKQPQL